MLPEKSGLREKECKEEHAETPDSKKVEWVDVDNAREACGSVKIGTTQRLSGGIIRLEL